MKGKRVRLGEVCSLSKGEQINGVDLSDEYGIPFLNGGINPSGKWKTSNVDANTVAISEGGNSCGFVNYMDEPFWCGAHCYYLYDLAGDAKYLYHALKARQKDIMSLRTGVCMPNIKKSVIASFEFLYHDSLSAQRKIAEELDRICALKRVAEKVVEKLGVLAKAKFNEMFGDLAVNQHGYKIVSFDDAASIEGGLETDYEKYANYPHIGIDSIEKDTGLLVGYRTVAQDHVKSGKYHFTEKHIIYSKIRPNLNKVALPSFEGLCSADAYAVLPGKNTDRVFLAYVLRSKQFLDYIVPLSGRSGMPKANQGQVRGFRFPLPPLPLQRQFAAYVGKVEKIEAAAKKVVEKLDVLYRAKLQEYFA